MNVVITTRQMTAEEIQAHKEWRDAPREMKGRRCPISGLSCDWAYRGPRKCRCEACVERKQARYRDYYDRGGGDRKQRTRRLAAARIQAEGQLAVIQADRRVAVEAHTKLLQSRSSFRPTTTQERGA